MSTGVDDGTAPDVGGDDLAAGGTSDVEADINVPWSSEDDANQGSEGKNDDEGEESAFAALDEEQNDDSDGDEAEEVQGDASGDKATTPPGFPEVNDLVEESNRLLPQHMQPTSDAPLLSISMDQVDEVADDERPRSKSAKQPRAKDKPIDKTTKHDETHPTKQDKATRTTRTSGATKDGSPPRDGLFKKERDMLALNMKKLRAIARKAPVQVRIWTEPRKVKSPMDKYVCAAAEAATSSGHQSRTTLFESTTWLKSKAYRSTQRWIRGWAAKGGATTTIEYLVECGADVHKRDDNGSMPLYAEHAFSLSKSGVDVQTIGIWLAGPDTRKQRWPCFALETSRTCWSQITTYSDHLFQAYRWM
ncbi:hypothetical protein, variant 7 [Aphanomyces astaci]|uniref:Uncharacterized protein n=1 Tax=Aphanomyces astaci TaxID=112090 RepID=W4H2B3_APHAT|nr:hypothetical protein, variant 8 [Aphanomyces astaci]XP_009825337.1 hypothetical protein, variant 7 [Aphanomyces astaci]ETV85307.1 hypothetical protein, variant 7 [Aphanomyces astaci]ETV85308.1 hypothetical protein, variant 8 [Aphanomyces astaci]|eukprot:XP_009825319.1 hypothetical protein, variant 8 [Aphanomyces astaci]